MLDTPTPFSEARSSASWQERLIETAERTGVPLAELLDRSGKRYDDLVYDVARAKRWTGQTPPTLADFAIPTKTVPIVSFFTGCGGMDLGFEAVGFEHVAAFEINELFCKTLRRNRPEWNVFGPPYHDGDVSKFETIVSALDDLAARPFPGVFVGGPPCQPFSIAANQRFAKAGDNFKRVGFSHLKNGNLLFDFVRIVAEYRPAAFVIENVPGLRDLDGGVQLAAAIATLQETGYTVETPFVLDAQNYSVPQQRQRLFVVGSLSGKPFTRPEPAEQIFGAGSVLSKSTVRVKNHETREHKAESIRRYVALGYGQRDQLGRVDRLDPTLPSKTVIAGGTNGGGRSHLHPEIPRTLSVRECARLQTFPDDYEFVGPSARQFTQVGNAVPPVLAAQIARAVRSSFF